MSQNKNINISMVPSSVEAAAVEAALADGLISVNGLYSSDEKSKKAGLRRGKWTSEEESYANRLIYEFKLGLLPLTEGTTLRTFLSKLLNCDPMRISKKFVGQNCIGKQVFRRRQQELEKLTPEQIEIQRRELGELERKFLERVATTNRSKTAAMPTVAVTKDGRTGFDEEGHGAVSSAPPPWMASSNPLAELSSVPADQLVGSNGHSNHSANAAQFFLQHHQQTFGQSGSSFVPPQRFSDLPSSLPAGFPPDIAPVPTFTNYRDNVLTTNNRGVSSGVEGFPRATSMDVLNSIAQLGSSTGSLDNLLAGDASALKHQQQMYHMRMMHPFGGGGGSSVDPTPDVFPGLALAPNSSALTLGDSMGWPSFGNLGSLGGGGSMDDLLSAGILSRQVSGGSPIDLNGRSGSSSKYALPKTSSLAVDEGSVGYPLEDSNHATGPPGTVQTQVRIKAPIVDMSSMSHHFPSSARGNHSSGSRDHGGNDTNSGGEEQFFDANNTTQVESNRLGNSIPSIPKNGSVEDFWMLVSMGDLPQPEQNVLSQMVWSPLERASASSAAAATVPPSTLSGGGGTPAGPGQGPLTMSPLPPPRQQPLPQPPATKLLPPSAVSNNNGNSHPTTNKRPSGVSIKDEPAEGEREIKRPKQEPSA